MEGSSVASLVVLRLAALALLAGGAYAWGCWCVRLRFFGGADEVAWRGAGGLVVLSTAAFGLTALGLLHPFSAAALLVAPWLHPRPWREARRLLGRVRAAPEWRSRVLLAGVALAPVFVWTLYPPTVFDSTLYHLPMARSYLDSGFVWLETLRFPVFPAFSELLFALMLPLAGDAAGNLVQFTQLLLAALILYATGRRYVSPVAGWLAAALWLGSPLVVWEAGAAMVDLGVALFVLMALAAWERARDGGGAAYLWAGAFGGAAAATKYTGLLLGAVLGLLLLAERRPWRGVVTACVGAALVAGPHFARLVLTTGDPVYPYLTAMSGHPDFQRSPRAGAALEEIVLRRSPSAGQRTVRAARALAFPYEIYVRRERWHRQPPVSPAVPLLLPVTVVLLRRRGLPRRWLGAGLFYSAALGFLLPPFPHYMLPALAVACLPLAAAGELAWNAAWRRRGAAPNPRRDELRRVVLGLGVGVLALGGPVYAARQVARHGAVPATASQRDRFLAGRVRGYAALAWLNQRHGERYTVYGLHLESSRYFSAGRFLGEWSGPWSYSRFQRSARSGGELAAFLRQAGAGYLLVAPEGMDDLPADPTFAAAFRLLRRDRDGTALYQVEPAAGGP